MQRHIPRAARSSSSDEPQAQLLSMETALLIATASGREIDVSVWFGSSSDGTMRASEFDRRIISLASTLSINQDEDVRKELQLSVSPIALRVIHYICNAGEDKDRQPLIDLNLFFRLCQERVDKYLQDIKSADQGESGDSVPQSPQENTVRLLAAAESKASKPSKTSEPAPPQPPTKVAAEDLTPPRPVPVPTSAAMELATKLTPSSPYDEECEFSLGDEEELSSDPDSYLGVPMAQALGVLPKTEDLDKDIERLEQALAERLTPKKDRSNFVDKRSAVRQKSPDQDEAIPAPREAARPRRATSSSPVRESTRRVTTSASPPGAGNRASRSTSRRGERERESAQPNFDTIKQQTEDVVRQTVRKADLYHLIQLNFGFLEKYTYVPPRGSIIQSIPKQWLSKRDIEAAFLAARVRFNDQQLTALRHLILEFARQHKHLDVPLPKSNDGEHGDAEPTAEEWAVESVFGHGDRLRAAWMQRYLVYLRLSRPRSSFNLNMTVGKSGAAVAADSEPPAPPAKTKESLGSLPFPVPPPPPNTTGKQEPLMWSEWLDLKVQRDADRQAVKPRELERALQGERHALSKKEITTLFKVHRILSAEQLQEELEYRVEAWVRDTDGRRDFSHVFNIRLRSLLQDMYSQTHGLEAGRKPTDRACWQYWLSKDKAERHRLRDELMRELVAEKRGVLESQERTQQDITIGLFQQYQKYLTDSGSKTTWAQWLTQHLKSFQSSLAAFKEKEHERLKAASVHKLQQRCVAPLLLLESNLDEVLKAVPLDAQRTLWLQKELVQLRKIARNNVHLYVHQAGSTGKKKSSTGKKTADHVEEGDYAADFDEPAGAAEVDVAASHDANADGANGQTAAHNRKQPDEMKDVAIVTKEEFDAHVRNVFALYFPGQQQQQQLAHLPPNHATMVQRFLKQWSDKIEAVFSTDLAATIQRSLEAQESLRQANAKKYDEWLLEKKHREIQASVREREKAEAKEIKDQRQKKLSAKAYRKWLKLRKKQQYQSMVDRKPHDVPVVRSAKHDSRWSTLDLAAAANARESLNHAAAAPAVNTVPFDDIPVRGSAASTGSLTRRSVTPNSAATRRAFIRDADDEEAVRQATPRSSLGSVGGASMTRRAASANRRYEAARGTVDEER